MLIWKGGIELMIEWIKLETEYEEFKEMCRSAKEYFTPKPIPSIVLWDPLYSRSFRSSQSVIKKA